MNERIKELMGKTLDSEFSHTWDTMTYEGLLQFSEKFAELIVRECVQTLLDNTPEQFTNEAAEEDWDRGYDQAMRDCVHHIKEHFGVES